MYYVFDIFGWLVAISSIEVDRSTPVQPQITSFERIEGELYPNFTGYSWNMLPYTHQDVPVETTNAVDWYIDIGPFFDRFGSQKLAVLSCTDPTVQAILRDVQVRKWVDLKRPDVAQALTFIGSKVSGLTPTIQAAIVNTPVAFDENMALRKMYFS